MAKRRNVSGRVLRNAVPQPRDVAEFVAPRTVNEGLSVKNVFGDVGDMIDPFITAAIEKQEGLRDVSDDELKMLAALGSIPVAGAVAGKLTKKLNKLVPNPKGGFVQLSTGYKNTTPKTIIQDAGLTGRDKRDFEECIKQLNIAINAPSQGARNTAYQRAIALRDRMSPKSKEALAAYTTANSARKTEAASRRTGQKFYAEPKPEGFDTWPADERIRYIKEETNPTWSDQVMAPENIEAGLRSAKITKDQGPLFTDVIMDADYRKALLDKEAEEALAAERAAAEVPITMTEVQDLSTGIVTGQASIPHGGTRQTYDHSRQFMDTELKQVPGIDRTGMSYGDDTDAFYDIYKTWRDAENPQEASKALYALRSEAKAGKSRTNDAIRQVDPYYAAGVVGDENNRLWSKIEKLRAEGKSDAKIREILKEDLDKYQGKIERFKERMPSKGHGSQFEYDGATTMGLKATPSEEARALRALGIDTKEYEDLEKLGNFYRVFFPK